MRSREPLPEMARLTGRRFNPWRHTMIRLSAIALSAGLATALVVQDSVAAQAAPDGRRYKMLVAPLVLGTQQRPPAQQGMGLSAGQNTQRLLLPAVQKRRDAAAREGGSRPKPREDCMSCAN